MAIGVTGIIAMQKVTMVGESARQEPGGRHADRQAWLDRARGRRAAVEPPRTDRNAASDRGKTHWLNNVDRRLVQAGLRRGDGVRPRLRRARQSAQRRRRRHRPSTARTSAHLAVSIGDRHVTGNGLIRAEVRVFWLREGGPGRRTATSLRRGPTRPPHRRGGRNLPLRLSDRRDPPEPAVMVARFILVKASCARARGRARLHAGRADGRDHRRPVRLDHRVHRSRKNSARFYQSETRVGEATLGGIVGFERLRTDIARAGFLASPNILTDPKVCGGPADVPRLPDAARDADGVR